MFKAVSYIMVNVSNMNRSVEFYRDQLGIPLKFTTPEWTEFSTGTTTLALHGGGKAAKPSQAEPVAGTCSFGFDVPDIDKAYASLKDRGVRFVMPPTVRPEEKIKLAVCLDPDGLGISLAQSI